ncbi:hypothetical protein HK096_009180, partial [Nowakowskiella sp. JEL0078]
THVFPSRIPAPSGMLRRRSTTAKSTNFKGFSIDTKPLKQNSDDSHMNQIETTLEIRVVDENKNGKKMNDVDFCVNSKLYEYEEATLRDKHISRRSSIFEIL